LDQLVGRVQLLAEGQLSPASHSLLEPLTVAPNHLSQCHSHLLFHLRLPLVVPVTIITDASQPFAEWTCPAQYVSFVHRARIDRTAQPVFIFGSKILEHVCIYDYIILLRCLKVVLKHKSGFSLKPRPALSLCKTTDGKSEATGQARPH